MHFKRLELYGFKSFVHKTALDFVPGVTVIAGPNGSGKSNLIEAIRWVLGEQNPRLVRAGRMEDVIFTGNEERRGLGRTEAVLTIDNTSHRLPLEFNEIAVARRLFRSGESEYLLNRARCHLRDVQRLWWETGLVTFIGQGEVEEIVLASPQERRVFLEKMAGLEKYEARKREALKKLESTEAELNRLNDLLAEINRQLEPLARECELARRYQEYQEQLRGVRRQLALREWVERWQRYRAVEEELSRYRRQAAQTAPELAGLRDMLDLVTQLDIRQEEERRALEAAAGEAEGRIREARARLAAAAGEARTLQERQDEWRREQQKWQEKEVQLAARGQELEADLARLTRQAEEKRARYATGQAELSRATAEASRAREEEEILKGRVASMAEQLARAGQEVSLAENRLQKLAGERADRERALAEATSSLQPLRDRLAAVQAAQEEYRRALEAAAGREEELEAMRAQEQQIRKELQRRREELEGADHRLQARVEVLRGWQAGFHGYYRGVRAVLQAGLPGIVGPVADILTVVPGAEAAVEAALGSALQYLVAQTPEDARRAIEYLKKSRAGQATFLPLTVIQPRYPGEELLGVLHWPGVRGLGRDFVQTTGEYVPVVMHLLGNIPLVEDLEVAWRVARKLGWRVKVVTMDGEVVSPGGPVSGGSRAGSGSSLLNRARELRQAEEQRARVAADLGRVNQEEEKARARWSDLEAALQAVREEHRKAAEELRVLARQEEFWLSQVQAWEEKRAAAEQIWAAGEHQVAAAIAELEEKRGRHASLEDAYQEACAAVESFRCGHGRNLAQVQTLQEQVGDLRVELATVEQQEAHLRQQLVDLEQRVNEARAEEARCAELLGAARSREGEIRQRQAEGQQELQALQQRLQETAARSAEAQQISQELQVARADLQARLAGLEKMNAENERRGHALEVEQARLASACDQAAAELAERFGYRPTGEEDVSRVNVAELQGKAHRLEAELAALGEVNLAAMAEYNRIKGRADFFLEQQADLEEGQRSLRRIIDQVTVLMEQRFLEELRRIDAAFNELFGYLFGGGRAGLALTDQQAPLDAGVEIVAQLPGKKKQLLTLLSGGEKGMTALALLLAILRVKPSPCSVFDEVDASLDDANVERFASLIKEMAGQQQFIIVTHRLGTMEIADVLYGVTMEEPGVSRIYSLNLADAEQVAG